MDSVEAQLLYDTSAQLIAAAAPESVLRAISQLGPPAKSTATLFTIESDVTGQPQWLHVAAHTGSAKSSAPAGEPSPRLELAAAPLTALWVRHPDRLQLIGEVGNDPRVDSATRAQCHTSGAAALLVLPLHLGDHFIGLIRLTWSAPQQFTERDERLFGALGKLAALTLEHRALLTQTQSAEREKLQQKTELQDIFEKMVDNSPSGIFAKDPAGRYLFINRKMETFLNKSRHEVVGKTDAEIWPHKPATESMSQDQQVLATGQQSAYEENALDAQGKERVLHKVKFPIFDTIGKLVAICVLSTDVTESRRIASERLVVQQKVIEAQSAELQELSTPLIPLAAGVVVMPLVGSIDNRRAEQIMMALLEGIAQQRAHLVIVDITGVRTVDTHVANALIRAARSAKLLGAKVVLTGIGAAVAQTLVQLGIDLGDVMTLNNLQSGIQYALGSGRLGSA